MVGVYADGWNLCAVAADRIGDLNLDTANGAEFTMLTTNAASNKQPFWFEPRRKAGR